MKEAGFTLLLLLSAKTTFAATAVMPTNIPSAQASRALAVPPQTTNRIVNGCISSASSGKGTTGEFIPMWMLKIKSVEVNTTQVRITGIDNVYAPAAENWARMKSTKSVVFQFPVNPSSASEKIAVTECINSARIAMASGIGFSLSGNFNMVSPNNNWEPCYGYGVAVSDGTTLSSCALDNGALTEKNSATSF